MEVKGRARRYVDPHTGREFPAVVDVNGRLHDLGGWTVELLEAELCELSSAEVAVLLDATAGLLVEGGDGRPDVRCVLLARAAALTVVT